MKIAIANDHRGLELKEKIKKYLHDSNCSCVDLGTNSPESVDYVDYAVKLCNEVINKNVDKGILICGTGIGMSIAANKIKGIRCARVCNSKEAALASEHNMANVIAVGENTDDIENIVKAFLETKNSEDERHIRRVNKIMNLE
jgi:ribose 5-phosphate isomerase B